MRRAPISQAVAEEEEINITPMLDVVFILLIFFIVTANFIKGAWSRSKQTRLRDSRAYRKCSDFDCCR